MRVWSFYYIDNEQNFLRFLFLLFLFIIRMVVLIFSSNLFIALIGWDGLGITSFLLVIFYKNRKRLGSGLLTALTNRIGDGLLLCRLGLYLMENTMILYVLIVLLRLTKRAQFPFSTWLPAAMAAPTPVRALVHSSTLVTAGVYILIRFCSLDLTPLLFIGRCTIFIAGVGACVERDLKKVVALRTLSQLGLMIIRLRAIEKTFCYFHMLSHACFKALLFICVGVCIHSVYGTQDYRRFNKLTSTLFISVFSSVANLSMLGFFFTSGFYSKDMILEGLMKAETFAWTISLFLIGIGLTTWYSIKIIATTLFLNTHTTTSTFTLGGYRWYVKAPLLILGLLSLTHGCAVGNYCRSLRLVAPMSDKLFPLLFITLGIILGFTCARLSNPFFRSIMLLNPFLQSWAAYVVFAGVPQKDIDKGWVGIGNLTFSTMASSIVTHYSPTFVMGLSVLYIYLLT